MQAYTLKKLQFFEAYKTATDLEWRAHYWQTYKGKRAPTTDLCMSAGQLVGILKFGALHENFLATNLSETELNAFRIPEKFNSFAHENVLDRIPVVCEVGTPIGVMYLKAFGNLAAKKMESF